MCLTHTACSITSHLPVTTVGADLDVGCCGRHDEVNCVHAAIPLLELCIGRLARRGDVCELGQTVLVQYHNYLVQGQEVQTIDIQAGYGFGGSDYAFRNSLARLWSTGQASKWQKRNDVSGRGGGGLTSQERRSRCSPCQPHQPGRTMQY